MYLIRTLLVFLAGPEIQAPERTNDFFQWYFYGLGGIGGWVLFFLLALGAIVWLLYDSQKRRLRAIGWRTAAVMLLLLTLPSMLYRFTVTPVHYEIFKLMQLWYGPDCTVDIFSKFNLSFTTCDQILHSLPAMTPYSELCFYLGLLGGILGIVVAVGYYITYQGMVGCDHGHEYEAVLGRCPTCAARERKDRPGGVNPPPPVHGGVSGNAPPVNPPKPSRPALGYAWLIDRQNNRRYDLFEGATVIGRASGAADIHLTDPAVSREHAKIREGHGHLTLSDLDSKTGTYLNGKRMRAPLVLQNGDCITLGDTELQVVTTQ